MLVDTSVWIDFFANRDTSQVDALEHAIVTGADIALCGIILTEILQGIRDDRQYAQVRQRLTPVLMLPITQPTFVAAADLYRQLRKRGLIIRKTNDCIIAATAIEHGLSLLHNDRDFDLIAAHSRLQSTMSVASFVP